MSANQQGDAAGLIKEAGCGFCVEAGDAKTISQALLSSYRNANMRKEMGKRPGPSLNNIFLVLPVQSIMRKY